MTCPRIFIQALQIFYQFCSQWIQMDVSNQFQDSRNQKSEVGSQSFRRKDSEFFSMEPSILPTDLHFSVKRSCSAMLRYPQSLAKSNHVSVSLFSPSESVSLLMKWASYLLFAQASRKLLHTERDDLLTWSVKEYFSSWKSVPGRP